MFCVIVNADGIGVTQVHNVLLLVCPFKDDTIGIGLLGYGTHICLMIIPPF